MQAKNLRSKDKSSELDYISKIDDTQEQQDLSDNFADSDFIETVYVQDLIQKTVVANENTLLAEHKVKVRLYEDDYVDFSTFLEF